MYKATIQNQNFELTETPDGLILDGLLLNWNLVRVAENYYHILYKDRSYNAEVVIVDRAAKSLLLKINGKKYEVQLKDKFDLLLEKMGMMNASASSKVNSIKAPMPGLIIDLKVKAGDAVKAGDQLLILEAMKMENIIKSPGDGVVKQVKIKKGDSVEKGQVLLEF